MPPKEADVSIRRVNQAPPALDPERMGLIQPWRDFVSRGLILEIVAKFTPGGTTIGMKLASSVKLPDGVERDNVPPGIAKQAIRDAGLSGKPGSKASDNKQPLPLRSLCVKDLEEENLSGLSKRIGEVSNQIGATSAAGRIGSLKLYVEGANNFKKWWGVAPEESKVRLLTNEKNFKEFSPSQLRELYKKLPDESPFRGNVPTPKEEEEDENSESDQGEKQLVLAQTPNKRKAKRSAK